MESEKLRQKLHQYIDSLDAVSLDEVYKIIGEEDIPWKYSAEDIAMFYQRRTAYLNGEGRNYTMDESINSIRK
jgi:hypothetical protein